MFFRGMCWGQVHGRHPCVRLVPGHIGGELVSLGQGSPAAGPWPSSGLWPVRNWVTEQEVSSE